MADLDVLESAYLYHELGFSTLPLLVGDKKPGIPSWKIYQDRRPSHSELEQWFGGDRRNIGIICGSVSQGLMVRDFDTENSYESWRESTHQPAKRHEDFTYLSELTDQPKPAVLAMVSSGATALTSWPRRQFIRRALVTSG